MFVAIRGHSLTPPRAAHKVRRVIRGPLVLLLIALFASASGCKSGANSAKAAEDLAMFRPVSMRIHPIFTRLRDWTTDQKPDGIDALIEFQDQFGDPCKAAGTVIFELYDFQKFSPERRGPRVCNPWQGSLLTLADQHERWNRTSRTYSFPLEYDQINPKATYVLTAQFQLPHGGRFFDQIVLEPPGGAYATRSAGETTPTTLPTTNATTTTSGGGMSFPGFGSPVTTAPSTAPASTTIPPLQPASGPANEPGPRNPQP